MSPIRVLIIDDHPMIRRGLRNLLASQKDIEVVGEAKDGATALQVVAHAKPNIILLDVQLPGPGGVEVAHQLRQQLPDAKIIILSAFDDEQHVFGALRAGAFAYLLKSTSDATLIETIRQVAQGKRLLSAELIDSVLRRFHTLANVEIQQQSNLSVDEIRALQLVAKGCTNEEISEKMFWSDRTVNRKLEEIMQKLDARNRAQAVAEAIKRGLI
ncbi:MAG: response regulator transcription factor [Chloroflexi bacterium]|nr:response regulator transcription factor [Chloroflexota bacterium]